MIEAAQRKLRGAQFYYRRLLEAREGKWNSEAESFRHFFSAFIQAARSVSWVMQREERAKYDAWLPTWEKQLKPEDLKLLKFTTTLRNEEVKEGGRGPLVQLEEVAFNEMLRIQGYDRASHPAHQQMPQQPALLGIKPVTVLHEKYYFEDEGERAEVMTVCREYLKYLEKFIAAFLSAHEH
jgi:hypothetical protein